MAESLTVTMRRLAAGFDVDCYRDVKRGRVWYPYSDDEETAAVADELNRLQAQLMARRLVQRSKRAALVVGRNKSSGRLQ